MHKLSNNLLRALLFAVLTVALAGCAASLLLAFTDLLCATQTEAYTYHTTLEYLLLHTTEALTFVPILLLFLAVCLGKASGSRLRALYTASLIVTLLLAVAGMLTDFCTDGIPEGTVALRNSLVFLPLLLLTADALLDHLLLARIAVPVQIALCALALYRLLPAHTTDLASGTAFLNEALRLLYFLAVAMLLYGHRPHTNRTVRNKISRLEAALFEAKEKFDAGELTEDEYSAKKAQILNAL